MFLDGPRCLLPENVRLLHFMCEGKANWRFPWPNGQKVLLVLPYNPR